MIYGYTGANGGTGTTPPPAGSGLSGASGGGQPQPARSDPTGFAGMGNMLGLSSNYNATAAPADYGGKGYGNAGNLGTEAGTAAGDVRRGDFSFKANDLSQTDPRIASDYANASKQIYGPGSGTPQIAGQVIQQNTDAAIAAQQAQAHSGSPNQGGLAAYNAAQTGAHIQQAGGQQAAQLQSQMQQQYDQMRLQAETANRNANIGLLNSSQQNAQFGSQFGLQQQGMNQDLYKYLMGLQSGYNAQNQQGEESYAGLASGNYNAAQNINAGVASDAGAAGQKVLQGTMTAAAAASDERLKTDISSDGGLADAFLEHLRPHSFRYKDEQDSPAAGKKDGHHLGIMAQDLERIPHVGGQIVFDGPRGKMVAIAPLVTGLAAAAGRLNERVRALEKRGR